ncbi:hypothetical protein F0L68_02080 [Solihabitans fulvus]|uniref:Carrier domain-containing protein n=2 Tax=Solihabitans fulvus TaxID=1892852 RepID=A0A5B2XUT1_9PSEU|nr:hypothetical protein F0L68_02080 [Solihabitans fulvus]
MPVPTQDDLADQDQHGRAERVLTEICADLLAVDRVSPKDNFFSLGGDSILGVRVAARAAKAGVHFTPQQLLQCRSVGELATVAVIADADTPPPVPAPSPPPAPEATPAGPLQLTPIMRSFLERTPASVGSFIEVQTLEVAPEIDGAAVRAAVDQLVTMHEALRYRFRRNSIGWHVECGDTVDPTIVDTRVLPPLGDAEERAVIVADCEAMQADLDLGRGPLLRVRHYRRGRGRPGLIVVLVHHFVFDNMSIVVLLDDLDTLLADHLAGRSRPASPRPAAWREWSRHLGAMAQSDELGGELGYWTAVLRSGMASTPPRGSAGSAGGIVLRDLDPPRVASVLTASAAEGREAATCAAACGLARWQGTAGAAMMVEGEATPTVYRPGGRGPSVGWFTSLHPVVLPVAPGASVREALPAATDAIRSVPNDGVGYGILRYLTPGFPAVAEFRSLPEPDAIMLHGPSDTGAFDVGVGLLRTRWDFGVNLKGPVASWFPLIIATAVRGGSLRLALASTSTYGQEELAALADEIVAAFAELATE